MVDENEPIDATSADDAIIPEEIECEADPDPSELGIDNDDTLSAAPPFPAVDTQLPASGTGFYSFSANRNKQFGLKKTIQAIEAIAKDWNAKYPRSPIGVGNISFSGGGTMPPHSSHKRGVDVDFRPQRKDGAKSPVTWNKPRTTTLSSEYSQTRTQDLINIIRSNGVLSVDLILFNDPGVTGVKYWKGHDNHLHVRFK